MNLIDLRNNPQLLVSENVNAGEKTGVLNSSVIKLGIICQNAILRLVNDSVQGIVSNSVIIGAPISNNQILKADFFHDTFSFADVFVFTLMNTPLPGSFEYQIDNSNSSQNCIVKIYLVGYLY